jgi:hypothetical protein
MSFEELYAMIRISKLRTGHALRPTNGYYLTVLVRFIARKPRRHHITSGAA